MKIRKYLGLNYNENTAYQNLRDCAFFLKSMPSLAYVRKEEWLKFNNVSISRSKKKKSNMVNTKIILKKQINIKTKINQNKKLQRQMVTF